MNLKPLLTVKTRHQPHCLFPQQVTVITRIWQQLVCFIELAFRVRLSPTHEKLSIASADAQLCFHQRFQFWRTSARDCPWLSSRSPESRFSRHAKFKYKSKTNQKSEISITPRPVLSNPRQRWYCQPVESNTWSWGRRCTWSFRCVLNQV